MDLKQLKKIIIKFDKQEDNNQHSENVVLLAQTFGTDEDLIEAKDIQHKHEKLGFMSNELMSRRDKLSNKLYPRFAKLRNRE